MATLNPSESLLVSPITALGFGLRNCGAESFFIFALSMVY